MYDKGKHEISVLLNRKPCINIHHQFSNDYKIDCFYKRKFFRMIDELFNLKVGRKYS